MCEKLTKYEFLTKLKTDVSFNKKYGRNDVTEGKQVLPPCHKSFQFYTRELTMYERFETAKSFAKSNDALDEYMDTKLSQRLEFCDKYNVPSRAISLRWEQRSVDTPLGLPFNIASYGLLLEIFGKIVNMVPERIIGHLGDTHIYLNQMQGVNTQLTRAGHKLPSVTHRRTDEFYRSIANDMSLLNELHFTDFELTDYESEPKIDYPLSN